MRTLRLLNPKMLQTTVGQPRRATALFWLGVIAILLQCFLGYTVLEAIGIDTKNVKLHPATVLAVIGGIWALVSGTAFHQRCRETPGLMLFVVAIPALALFASISTGVSGAAIYPETYWSAGLLALMLEPATPKQKRLLAKILIAVCVLNVFVALYEHMTSTEWFPLIVDPDNADKITDADVDFRANAFFNHSLTGSLITTMAIFLVYTMRMRFISASAIFGILLVGMFAYGGRTALGVLLVFTLMTTFYMLMQGIIRRNLKFNFVLSVILGAMVIPIIGYLIITQTSIADRIMDTLYFDDSAEVRATQFKIFSRLTLPDWLFGMSHDHLDFLKFQIGLGSKEVDIENFWLLMILYLGVIGFAVFTAAFLGFLYHLCRVSRNMNGWLLVAAALIIDSGSNSLGVKTYDLFLEVAFVVAMSGYADYAKSPRLVMPRVWERLKPAGRRTGALGDVAPAQSRGLQVMASRPS
jgi:hypothetical protein